MTGKTSAKPARELDRAAWYLAAHRSSVSPGSPLRVRIAGRQIALFDNGKTVFACNNLCPHEGYPLSEGSLSGRCILTCNWHNWKFDLESGANLLGGDCLTTYPVELRDDEIWIDLSDPPLAVRQTRAVKNLEEAFDDVAYDRLAREIARLIRLDSDPLEPVRLAIHRSWERLEFGWTHAYAGMADWLTLYHEFSGDPERQLVCLVESVAHAADDVLRETVYPYATGLRAWKAADFLAAIENEDEERAIALLRGGLADGLGFSDFESALTRAALAHYQDFGHALIYVYKMRQLGEMLGPTVLEPLLLSLARSLVYATREDRIPEFRHYEVALADWRDAAGSEVPAAENWRGRGIRPSLQLAVDSAGSPAEVLYRELLMANAWNMLHFDRSVEDRINVSVSGNIGWLDFTHGITFANAVWEQCTRFPEFWPAGLLQMACFQGRNAAYIADEEMTRWIPDDPEAYPAEAIEQVVNHGQGEYIVSVHMLKTSLAVRQEISRLPGDGRALLAGALRRFIGSPLRRRRPRRTAWQSLRFVAREYGDIAEEE